MIYPKIFQIAFNYLFAIQETFISNSLRARRKLKQRSQQGLGLWTRFLGCCCLCCKKLDYEDDEDDEDLGTSLQKDGKTYQQLPIVCSFVLQVCHNWKLNLLGK